MSTITEWLEAVGAGLGAHADTFHEYGAIHTNIVGTFDEEDIMEIAALLRAAEGGPAPLQLKWILKALRAEVAAHGRREAAAAAKKTPPTEPPRARHAQLSGDSSAGDSMASDDDEESEEEDYEEEEEEAQSTGGAGKAAARRPASTQRPRARKGKKAAEVEATSARKAQGANPRPVRAQLVEQQSAWARRASNRGGSKFGRLRALHSARLGALHSAARCKNYRSTTIMLGTEPNNLLKKNCHVVAPCWGELVPNKGECYGHCGECAPDVAQLGCTLRLRLAVTVCGEVWVTTQEIHAA
jgi:hypothetical protein